MDWFFPTFSWYLMTTVTTIAIAPLALWLGRGVVDRGASFVRPVAALALIWPIWFLASFMSGVVPFTEWALIASLVIVGGISWFLGWRNGLIDRIALKHLVIAEVGFLVFFALFLWFHGYGPQINEQEKPGDLMMLASSMRSTSMPPNDAWMAGETINYYYMGYLVWAAIAKIVNVTPWEAFNLALASVFAMTCIGIIGLVANIAATWVREQIARIAGIVALVLVVIGGNPWAAFTAIGDWSTQWTSFYFSGIGWTASRTIHDVADKSDTVISEFPSFSFILADLHPHLLALPFAIGALGLAWALFRGVTFSSPSGIGRVVVTGAFVGSLYAMNSWDMPTYLLVTVIALVIGTHALAARQRVLAVATLVLSALIAWLPFYVNFEAPTRQGTTGFASTIQDVPVVGGILASLVRYQGERTDAGEFLGVFGFVWVIAIVLISTEFWQRRHAEVDRFEQQLAIGAILLLILGAILVPMPVLALAGIPIVLSVMLIQRDPRISAANVSLGLFTIGFLITILPEFFFLGDIYTNRMNTIFKLYYQTWLLTGVAAAIAVVVIWQTLRKLITERVATIAVSVATAAILVLGVIFPIVGGKQWLDWRNVDRDWIGIDGLAYVDDPAEAWSSPGGEYEAIEWLYENANEDDVMLAAGGCTWSADIGRPAGATGVPTILGWQDHEAQWHLADASIYTEINQRTADITTLYASLDPALLDKYDITLLYIGSAETNGPYSPTVGRALAGDQCAPGPFASASDPNFPGDGWTEIYNADGVRIYRRNDA